MLETEKFGGRKWPGEVLRLAMLMTHYREPIDFTSSKLEEASRELQRWERIADETKAQASLPDEEFMEALRDDLNFSGALRRVHQLMNMGRFAEREQSLEVDGFGPDQSAIVDTADVNAPVAAALASLRLLGINPLRSGDVSEEAKQLVAARLAFIREKNWAEADRIRDELLGQGIQLKDGKDPATGERVTTWEVKR